MKLLNYWFRDPNDVSLKKITPCVVSLNVLATLLFANDFASKIYYRLFIFNTTTKECYQNELNL